MAIGIRNSMFLLFQLLAVLYKLSGRLNRKKVNFARRGIFDELQGRQEKLGRQAF